MARKMECIFKPVNGDKTGSFTRTGMSKSYPSPGILYMKNCPDNKTFYCDPDDGGQNGYYRLLNPSDYKINSSGKVYAWIDKSYLVSWKIIDDTPPPAPPTPVQQPVTQTAPLQPYSQQASTQSTQYNLGGAGSSNDGILFPKTNSGSLYEPSTYINTNNVKRTNFYNDYSEYQNELRIIERNLNIGLRQETVDLIRSNIITKFNRFLTAYPDIQLSKSFSHVFFTRPDLNLYQDITGNKLIKKLEDDPVFYFLNKNNPDLLKSLTKDLTAKHSFNPFLSNMSQSFELKDEVLTTVEHGETLTGWKIKYGKHNIESRTADSFSINYTDDEDYRIYKIHKAWTDYISKVYRGEFRSSDYNITNRILDYACSVYYFLCGPDGETILFWSKYTGVFPTNTPSSSSSWQAGDTLHMPKISINYEYAWKEDFNPVSLAEFNINSNISKAGDYKYVSTYENMLTTTGKSFVGQPFIESSAGADGYTFKLRFMQP